jgi:hypothetical protein
LATTFATGEKLLSGRYESLDYEVDESEISHMEEKRLGYQHKRRLMVMKWMIMLLIGICTGLIAVVVDFSVKNLTRIKFSYVQTKLDSCLAEHCLFRPYLAWIVINVVMVLISGFLILWEVTIDVLDVFFRLFYLFSFNNSKHVFLFFILIVHSRQHEAQAFHKSSAI